MRVLVRVEGRVALVLFYETFAEARPSHVHDHRQQGVLRATSTTVYGQTHRMSSNDDCLPDGECTKFSYSQYAGRALSIATAAAQDLRGRGAIAVGSRRRIAGRLFHGEEVSHLTVSYGLEWAQTECDAPPLRP